MAEIDTNIVSGFGARRPGHSVTYELLSCSTMGMGTIDNGHVYDGDNTRHQDPYSVMFAEASAQRGPWYLHVM